MCVPYASDSGGAPVGGLGGIAGVNADLFKNIGGTVANSMAGLTGNNTGIVPTGAPGAGLSSGIVPGPVPTAGATVLSGGSANTGLPPTPSPPNTEPVASTPVPAIGNPAAAKAAQPPWKGWGTDPLPQTSGESFPLAFTGHESLSPHWAQRMGQGGGKAVAVPTPPARPETAAVPGTEPVSYTGPTAGQTVLSGGSANTGTIASAIPPGGYVGGKLPDTNMMASYIRQRAATLGIDPDVAEAVARSEGLGASTWQSNLAGGGGPGNLEASFGPFQLNDKYMGADFTRATGLRASDPATWKEQVDFVLGRVPTTGWAPFHGAARVGIGARQGLPGAVSGAGPSDSGLAANGAPLLPVGTAGAAGAIGPEGVAGASGADSFASGGSGGDDDLSRPATTAPAARTRSIEYHNNNVRNKPLSPKLESVIEAATAPEGVTTRVISGGQPPTGGDNVRTGSHRHDEATPGGGGQAGDVQFIKDGRALDMTNPADLQIIIRIMSRIYGGGAQGLGASPAYMGSRTFHVGFGTPAVWGAGGQGANAPPWLRQIAASGGIPMPGGTGGTAVASASPTAAPTSGSGVLDALAGLGRLGGGGGGGGRTPSSGMDARIEEFLTADALRRKKLRESLPAIGELPITARHIQGDRWDVASLASIIGGS